MKKFVVFVSFLILVIHQGSSIRITRFVVPTVASFGDILELDCAYDLEGDQLYDVKWYKDTDEFFRCKSDGHVQAFEVEGVEVYHNKESILGSCPISISVVSNHSAGQYRCEISTEAPEFKTTARSVVLRISNIKPLKRIQQNVLPTVTEASLQKNGSQSGIFARISFTYIILINFVNYLKINVVWF